MPPQTKTIKKALADMLEDLSELNFAKFCFQLRDRDEEPRIRRNKVDGKHFLEVVDVLVSTFTEANAVGVAVEVLRQIDLNWEADNLVKETIGSSTSGSSDVKETGGSSTSGSSDQEHFVDKHRVELIKRVTKMGPILDVLLDKNVISEEKYDEIMALPTSQGKMRALYSGGLRASGDCKDVFLKILTENESFLINDLKKYK